MPRPSHTKKDEAKVKEFRETLAKKLKTLELPKDRPVKLWDIVKDKIFTQHWETLQDLEENITEVLKS